MSKKEKFELKKGKGFLHLQKDQKNEDAPSYYGTLNVDGEVFVLSGWKREGENSGNNYIGLTMDLEELSIDEKNEARKENTKQYKKDKKDNKDTFIVGEGTGNLHKSTDEKKDEDFFGSAMLNGNLVYLNGMMGSKNDKSFIKLNVSDGMKSKEERTELADGFLD